MSLRLYDTGTRSVRGFEPIDPPKVTVYLCGDTVPDPLESAVDTVGRNFAGDVAFDRAFATFS